MKSDLVDLEVTIHLETGKAILVSLDGNRLNSVWLPKMRVEAHHTGTGRIYEITLPESLAIEKGLV